MSNSSDRRRTAPRPVPGDPAVEWPSLEAARDVANPGTAVERDQFDRGRRLPEQPMSSSPPPVACLTRFVASSVATRPTRCASVSFESRPFGGLAGCCPGGERLAVLVNGDDGMRDHFQRVMITRVPFPVLEAIANSFDEPLRPRQTETEPACRSSSRRASPARCRRFRDRRLRR